MPASSGASQVTEHISRRPCPSWRSGLSSLGLRVAGGSRDATVGAQQLQPWASAAMG